VFFYGGRYLVGDFEDCGEKQKLVDDDARTAMIRYDSDFQGLGAAGKTTL